MDELKPRQTLAASLIATGETVAATAKKVGVSTPTLFRWLQDQTFKAAISTRVTQIEQQYQQHLISTRLSSLDNLHCLASGSESDSVKLQATLALLRRGDRVMELRGRPPEQADARFVDEVAAIAVTQNELLVGNLMTGLGVVESPQEWLGWAESRKLYTICILDCFGRFLDGEDNPEPDPELWHEFLGLLQTETDLDWLHHS